MNNEVFRYNPSESGLTPMWPRYWLGQGEEGHEEGVCGRDPARMDHPGMPEPGAQDLGFGVREGLSPELGDSRVHWDHREDQAVHPGGRGHQGLVSPGVLGVREEEVHPSHQFSVAQDLKEVGEGSSRVDGRSQGPLGPIVQVNGKDPGGEGRRSQGDPGLDHEVTKGPVPGGPQARERNGDQSRKGPQGDPDPGSAGPSGRSGWF